MSSPITDKYQPISHCCFALDPIRDPRWAELVARHAKAAVFHTVPWLQALQATYGYEPLAFTTSPPGVALQNGILFCRINSWLTGRRLVSLPFSDHCEPLCDSAEEASFLLHNLQAACEHQGWRYLEVRPIDTSFGETCGTAGFQPASTYFLHVLDLSRDLEVVFRTLDDDSVQRRIKRAERAGLVEKCGRSDDLLEEFYTLFEITRGRHHLPPIPYAWFRNLIQCQDKALEIRLAYKDEIPISAILTLQFKDAVYYKYGGSDTRFNRFGATPWLLWRAIAAAKSNGTRKFDMGRTEEGNVGLLAFKNHWVPQPKRLIYWKFPETSSFNSINRWKLKAAKRVFSYMPTRLLRLIGKLTYPHIG